MADTPQTTKTETKTAAPKAQNERVYTIPLRNAWKSPYKRRTKKTVSLVREFIMRHMKVEKVRIGMPLNETLWEQGVKNPPRRIKVKTAVVDNVGYVDLPESVFEFEKKAAKEAKAAAPKKAEAPKAEEPKVEAKPEEKKAAPAKKADEKGAVKKAPEAKK